MRRSRQEHREMPHVPSFPASCSCLPISYIANAEHRHRRSGRHVIITNHPLKPSSMPLYHQPISPPISLLVSVLLLPPLFLSCVHISYCFLRHWPLRRRGSLPTSSGHIHGESSHHTQSPSTTGSVLPMWHEMVGMARARLILPHMLHLRLSGPKTPRANGSLAA